jgi:hypothetical protein
MDQSGGRFLDEISRELAPDVGEDAKATARDCSVIRRSASPR